MTRDPVGRLSRHKQREIALQVLFAGLFVGREEQAGVRERTLAAAAAEAGCSPDDLSLTFQLVDGVVSNQAHIDERISRYSQNWKLTRIARLELTILRIAMFEMEFVPDVPAKVSINEAVELAKAYGDGNSGVFVNGILDAAARSL
jgi:N utilization substance protein B